MTYSIGSNLKRLTEEARAKHERAKKESEQRAHEAAHRASLELYNKVWALFTSKASTIAGNGESCFTYEFGRNEWSWLLDEHKDAFRSKAKQQDLKVEFLKKEYMRVEPGYDPPIVNVVRITW